MIKNALKAIVMAVLVIAFAIPVSQAAFPVKKNATEQTSKSSDSKTSNTSTEKSAHKSVEKQQKKADKSYFEKLRDGGKSQLVALLLVILVGGLGIHRFYLGYTWQGVVQLLTLGGCGIWALIDLIRIITGDLEPKNGPYDKTL